MSPDVREPVRYGEASGVTIAIVLLSSAAMVTGTLATLGQMDLPGWLGVLVALIAFGVVGYAVTWALRAGTTLDREHLRITGAFRETTVPWEAIDAVHGGSSIAVLVDGEWLPDGCSRPRRPVPGRPGVVGRVPGRALAAADGRTPVSRRVRLSDR